MHTSRGDRSYTLCGNGLRLIEEHILGNEDKNEAIRRSVGRPAKAEDLIRIAIFSILGLLWLVVFWHPLYSLAELAFRSDPYSHTVLVPFVSAFFVYWTRSRIFSKMTFAILPGLALFSAGAIVLWLSRTHLVAFGTPNGLSLSILALVIFLLGSFVLCYGVTAGRAGAFPLLFLFLMVPIPSFALEKIISVLQHWTASCTATIFGVLGVPFYRDGLVFTLPGVSILVAQECSGIRSSTALFITVLLAAQLYLKSNWRKLTLCVLIVPVAVAKNAIRIATLSILAAYVDRSFLFGRLHHDGGIVFFLLGLAVLIGALRLLELWERRSGRSPVQS